MEPPWRQSPQHVSEAAQELLAAGTDFGDGASVNRFLGALVRQVTLKRIPRRDAVTLAYICQLLLNSLGTIHREVALRLEESRIQAMNAAKRPPRILWDIPARTMNLPLRKCMSGINSEISGALRGINSDDEAG